MVVPLINGGEGGIRTLDGLLTHTPLAGERLQPLGHLSIFDFLYVLTHKIIFMRYVHGCLNKVFCSELCAQYNGNCKKVTV